MRLKKARRNYLAAIRAGSPAGSLSPIQVCGAYQLAKVGAVPAVKIGIGSLGGAFPSTDIALAAQAFGYPAPNLSVITVDGATISPDPGGADVENMLDAQLQAAVWSYCTGTPANITACIGPNSGVGIADVTSALVAAGCKVITWSWGAPISQWTASDLAVTRAAFADAAKAGVMVFAASGDNSLDDGTRTPTVDYPCADVNVWAVGGTRLVLAADGSIASEMAWGDGRPGDEGGGGGFDPSTPAPTWQQGVIPAGSPGRGCPDSSANADPQSGYLMYTGGHEITVGGTSGSCPLTGAYAAVCLAAGGTFTSFFPTLYAARQTAFHDIVLGSDGAPAVTGWDEATGLGSINGPGFLEALKGSTGGGGGGGGGTHVFGGTIQNLQGNVLTLLLGQSGHGKTFTVPANCPVELNRKPAKLSDLATGMRCRVTVNTSAPTVPIKVEALKHH